MSYWTQINASFYVDTETEETRENLKKYIENILENAPEITGSEGSASYYINILNGHNIWANRDCSKCEYKTDKIDFLNGCENLDKCQEVEYQTCANIVLIGDLRDRFLEQTRQEYKEFKKYINKHFAVLNSTHKIRGQKFSEIEK